MSSLQFQIYYLDGLTPKYCANVAYRMETTDGQVVVTGSTNDLGKTKRYDSREDRVALCLKVRKPNGEYVAPDLHDDPKETNQAVSTGGGVVLHQVRIRPYYRVKFVGPNDLGVMGAAYKAFAVDAQGKKALAVDLSGAPIQGSTDGQGETKKVECVKEVQFEFTYPGADVVVPSPWLKPLVLGQPEFQQTAVMRMSVGMTAPNPDHKMLMQGKTSAPMLIETATNELMVVPQSAWDELAQASSELERIMSALHVAKADLALALESQQAANIDNAQTRVEQAQKTVTDTFNKKFNADSDLREFIAFEQVDGKMVMRRRYLSSQEHEAVKKKSLLKGAKLEVKFPGGKIDPRKLDRQSFNRSVQVIANTLKQDVKLMQAQPLIVDIFSVGANAYADTIAKSSTYEVSASAQWLRLVAGAGASAQVQWKDKRATVQGNLQGKLVLCEGKVDAKYGVPSLKGWCMSYREQSSGVEIDLGALRFLFGLELYGFAGAELAASGMAGINFSGGKQIVKGIKPSTQKRMVKAFDPKRGLPGFEVTDAYEDVPSNFAGVKSEIKAFAGVEVGVTPKGAIQWLPPEENDFVSFAEVSVTAAFEMGVGAEGTLAIYYRQGKFRIKVAAAVCWGVGCKGSLEFSVDAGKILEFVRWVYYQLAYAGFKVLVYIEELAFNALSQLLVLMVAYIDEGKTPQLESYISDVNTAFDAFRTSLSLAEERHKLVNRINRKPEWLQYLTPEARGMLLYQITRHGKVSHAFNLPSLGTGADLTDPEVHYLPAHKEAVLALLQDVHVKADWANVLQHMTVDGRKLPNGGTAEGEVMDFLNYGASLRTDLPATKSELNIKGPYVKAWVPEGTYGHNEYLNKYLTKRSKLLGEFPKGYTVASIGAMSDTQLAAIDGQEHPQFAQWAGDDSAADTNWA